MRHCIGPAAVLAAILVSAACTQLAPRAIAQGSDPPGVKAELVKAIEEALAAEKDDIARLYLAKALIKLAPENKDAAQELVKGFLSKSEIMNAEANKVLGEVIQAGPAALVRALIPLLKDKSEVIRRQTADLLAKVDPKAISK